MIVGHYYITDYKKIYFLTRLSANQWKRKGFLARDFYFVFIKIRLVTYTEFIDAVKTQVKASNWDFPVVTSLSVNKW